MADSLRSLAMPPFCWCFTLIIYYWLEFFSGESGGELGGELGGVGLIIFPVDSTAFPIAWRREPAASRVTPAATDADSLVRVTGCLPAVRTDCSMSVRTLASVLLVWVKRLPACSVDDLYVDLRSCSVRSVRRVSKVRKSSSADLSSSCA